MSKGFPWSPSRAKSKVKSKAGNSMRRAICDFARDHGFVIHPKGYDYFIESYFMFNACSCDLRRKSCPCPEAVIEVPRDGHCLCRLFWKSYDVFKKEMLH